MWTPGPRRFRKKTSTFAFILLIYQIWVECLVKGEEKMITSPGKPDNGFLTMSAQSIYLSILSGEKVTLQSVHTLLTGYP